VYNTTRGINCQCFSRTNFLNIRGRGSLDGLEKEVPESLQ
jgi:hypothetical protein